MAPAGTRQTSGSWLAKNGPQQLELLLRSVLYDSSMAVLIANDDRKCLDASFGMGRLIGLSRDQIVDRSVDDFVDASVIPSVQPLLDGMFLQGRQDGILPLVVADGATRELAYAAITSVMPQRHLLALDSGSGRQTSGKARTGVVPSWAKDVSLFLLDAVGCVVSWHSGAERMIGYPLEGAVGRHLSFLGLDEENGLLTTQVELRKAAATGRFGCQGWRRKKDGTRFWANVLTIALRDDDEQLQGFASVVRDFTARHEADQKFLAARAASRAGVQAPKEDETGVVAGEYDRVTSASDGFVRMLGYSQEELIAGRPYWPSLTAPEDALLDERAHEEALVHGACAPFEKEYIHKDGSRVPAVVVRAILSLAPFRWTAFIQRSTEPDSRPTDEDVPNSANFEGLVGRSSALKRVLKQVAVVAPTDATVLILGETGTGKELVARAIHKLGNRREHPFVTLNCAAIPSGLLESELFGYEKGAFTGALTRKKGRFELAHKGTLFLDEIGDISLDLQPKLLRALQEKEFERLGGTRTIPIDVRLVAATNRNLVQMMGDRLFRADLYYRLQVFPLTITALRDRTEDIPLLVRHFVGKYAERLKRNVQTIPAESMRAFVEYAWPGNVRELENFIERSVILSTGSSLTSPLDELRSDVFEPETNRTLEQVDRDHILRVLQGTGGVISSAAKRLGMPRTTLNAMMRKLGISRKDL